MSAILTQNNRQLVLKNTSCPENADDRTDYGEKVPAGMVQPGYLKEESAGGGRVVHVERVGAEETQPPAAKRDKHHPKDKGRPHPQKAQVC